MTIQLKFQDLVRLAMKQQIEKEGVTITCGRPVLSTIKVDPKAKTGSVLFYIDETDDKRLAEFDDTEYK
jgi:hypothetical protein